jgi:ribonuclease P/MRP protein subunit RPP1
MFYDLNVPWSANDASLPRTLNFLHELGYNVVALNHTMTGKLPNELVSIAVNNSCDAG